MNEKDFSAPALAITGSTGRLGGMVARALAQQSIPQRLLVRTLAKAPNLTKADVHVSTYFNTEETRNSLAGVKTLFMVSAAESSDRLEQHRQFIEAAAASGVQHLVYTSFLGASEEATFTLARDHWSTEEYIRDSGMSYTFLRDNFYQDIFPLFESEGLIAGPAGHGTVAAVAIADVAAVATKVLQNPENFAKATLDLTGPRALSLEEIAHTIEEVTGRPTRYLNQTLDEALATRAPYQPEEWQMDAWISTYTAIAADELSAVTSTVQDVLGRPAQTFEETLRKSLTRENR